MYRAPLACRVTKVLEHPAGAGPGVAAGLLRRDRDKGVLRATAPCFLAPRQEDLECGHQPQGLDLLRGEPDHACGPVLEPRSATHAVHAAPIASKFHQRIGRPAGTPVMP